MQGEKQLTKQQLEEYTRLRFAQNGLDDRTLDLCLKYYLEYRNSTNGHIAAEKLQLVFKSALFMAEKSQRVSNLKGEKMSLPSLSLGQLLRTHQLDEVMITLKEFSRHVKINDKEASADLNNLIKEISFLITFHKKFEKSIEKLELRERGNDAATSEYLKLWSSFSWLLYIQAKNKILGKSLDLIENTCMLANSIAFMLSFSWEYMIPKAILRQDKRINEQSSFKDVLPILRDRVLEMFSIKTMEIFTSVATAFEDFFEKELVKKGVVRNTQQNMDFLSNELLPQNYRRLDRLYEKNMAADDLDERIFFKERLSTLTPSKFTPFARQGYANKGRKGNANDTACKQNFSSHRILNYEMTDKLETTAKCQVNPMGRLPKAVLVSPSTMKVPLICSTPITTGMEMFNYVNQKARKFKEMLSQSQIPRRAHEPGVLKYVDLLYEKAKKDFDKKTKQVRQGLIYSLFKLGLEDYLSQHPADKDNEDIFKALMAMAIQIVLFVSNSPLSFQDVQRQINTPTFQLWKACDFFLKFDKSMPAALKLHLLDIEVGMISFKVWRDKDTVHSIHRYANGQRESDPVKMEFIEKLFRRMLHQTAFQIQQMCVSVHLEQQMQENALDIMKFIFTDATSLLLDWNIDQLIMCSVFATCKREKKDILFSQIIKAYIDNNPYNKQTHESLIYVIQTQNRQPFNLVTFYNEYFIGPVKDYYVRNANHIDNKKTYANIVLQSPLRDILPRDLNRNNIKRGTKEGNIQLLSAYNNSPLLKHEPIAFKGQTLQSKKVINFEQEEEAFFKKQQQKPKQFEKLSPRNLNIPSQIHRKFSSQNTQNNQNSNPSIIRKLQQQPQQPMLNGHTPSRPGKANGQANYDLSQFTSNPTPPTNNQAKAGLKSQQYVMITAFNKGNRHNYP